MKEHLKQYGTVLESWFPLGGRGHTQELFNDPTISSIAAAHGKTSAQVLLRWHLQVGNIAIPGSSNEAHIQENFEIFDFELTDAEMQQISPPPADPISRPFFSGKRIRALSRRCSDKERGRY